MNSTPQHGRLEAIWLKRVRRGPMDHVPAAELVAGQGLVGNANQGGWRQVTIIEQEAWQELMAELESDLPPSTRRANLMLSGIRLRHTRGALLTIGDCQLRITTETRPCNYMEDELPGLEAAMRKGWRGGVSAAVERGGMLRVGEAVSLEVR